MLIEYKPPQDWSLKEDEVHIWFTLVPENTLSARHYFHYLSQDEKERAASFYTEELKDSYIYARSMLRHILSKYTGSEAEKILFSYSAFGKPQLLDEKNVNLIQFNMSHSKRCIVYAIGKTLLLGIDVEYITNLNIDSLAKLCFSAEEYHYLQTVLDKDSVFFQFWTCKEAFVKALGKGFFFPITNIEFCINNNEVKILNIKDSAETIENWSIHTFEPYSSYVGALAIKNKTLPRLFMGSFFESCLS